ncbi:hypothetical protein E2C01_082468 [Portunus trituberculatus]|uniref:Endonuclease/exonuclease/phosphatase domain-containing protein n=1 Tax=Portunus trituberculatus TaxID=210409 RepID=A0A5B7IUN5_PORTR|nr:hypothetical protein [Portunus trituberculatus]
MVTSIYHASESPSREGTKNVPRSDASFSDDHKCHDTSLNFFYINFCNIRGLKSNFQSMEHHLFSTKPHLLFLTETQLSEATDSDPSLFPPTFSILISVPKLDVASIDLHFNVHHKLWLSSPFTDHPGELAFNFAILHDLEQLNPPKRRCLWCFGSTSWGDLRRYYADFPWNDYCFRVREPSLCAERITEMIVSGMEAYIPHSFSQPKPSITQPVAHKMYLTLSSPESHALYISARNHAKSVLQLVKHSFISRKCQNLSNSTPHETYGI